MTKKEEKKIIKELVDNDIHCLKIENKNGEELESVYLTDDYTAFVKVSRYSGKNKKTFLDTFIKLLQKN